VRAELDEYRDRRNRFMNDERFYGAEETSKFLLTKIGALEQRLIIINGDISSQELRVASLGALVEKSGPELEQQLSLSVPTSLQSIVTNIKFELQKLNLRREELMQMYTDKHPELVAVNQQIADLHADLKQQVENIYRVETIALEEMKARRPALLEEINASRTSLDAVPDREREVAELDQMIRSLEEKHKLLISKQSESEIASAGHPEWDVSILSAASPPRSKKTRDYIRLALGPMLACIVGLGLAFFMENVDHSVKSRAEAEEFLEVPVLATISEIEPRSERAAGGG
jgi:uncharacterized protein involved in exopolysaccharide biosynthesis